MSDQFPTPPENITTEVFPRVQNAAPRPAPNGMPVPQEFGPRVRSTGPSFQAAARPPVLRIHEDQWEQHVALIRELRTALWALFSLVVAVLVVLGYVTLTGVEIVNAIHVVGAASIGAGL